MCVCVCVCVRVVFVFNPLFLSISVIKSFSLLFFSVFFLKERGGAERDRRREREARIEHQRDGHRPRKQRVEARMTGYYYTGGTSRRQRRRRESERLQRRGGGGGGGARKRKRGGTGKPLRRGGARRVMACEARTRKRGVANKISTRTEDCTS